MKTQHTPGPWKIIGNPNLVMVEITNNPDFVGKHTVVCNCDYQQTLVGGSKQANARLIAAAPELLEACKRLVPWVGKMIADGHHLESVAPNDAIGALQQAETAIQKAKGD